MRLLSNGEEPGVISLGENAIGIVAVGQFARGIIAIGQVAIGVFTLGQFAVSIFGVGQFGIGVAWFAGMFGLGGRGLCLRLIPGLDLPRDVPATVPLESVAAGPPDSRGLVRLEVEAGGRHARFALAGRVVPVKPSAAVSFALTSARGKGLAREVLADVKRVGSALVCERVVEIPGTRRGLPLVVQGLRVTALAAAGCGWWYAMTTHFGR